MSFELQEQVQALFNGEWHDATIFKVEAPGVYTVRWARGNGGWMSEGYTEAELVSLKWRDAFKGKDHTQLELNKALEQLYATTQRWMDKGFSDDEETSSGELSSVCEEGIAAAQDILEREAAHQRVAANRRAVENNFVLHDLPLEDTVWAATEQDGVACYWTPDERGAVAARKGYDEMLIALAKHDVQRLGEEGGERRPWIRLAGDLWVPADHVVAHSERSASAAAPSKPQGRGKGRNRGRQPEPAPEPKPWMFRACRRVVLLGRRVEARAIHNALLEDTPAGPDKTMETIQEFFPRVDACSQLRSICEVLGIKYRSGDGRLTQAALEGCLATLWEDVHSGIEEVDERSVGPEHESRAVVGMAALRVLTRNRFDPGSPALLQYVLSTGRIRVSNYLYAVGPPVSKAWCRAIANGLGSLQAKAKSQVVYDNVQVLLKYGYRLPLESITRKWSKWCKHVSFKWDHKRALRTFKIRAKREGSTKDRRAVAREGLADRRVPTIVSSIILGYLNDFKYYEDA